MVTVCFILLNTCNLIVCAQILYIYSNNKYILKKETCFKFLCYACEPCRN
jgi:Gpi18-like mannosyltransferase